MNLISAGSFSPTGKIEVDLRKKMTARIRRYTQARLTGYDGLYYQYKRGYPDEEFYNSRVAGSIKRMGPFRVHNGML